MAHGTPRPDRLETLIAALLALPSPRTPLVEGGSRLRSLDEEPVDHDLYAKRLVRISDLAELRR